MSPRQQEVAQLIYRGLSAWQIAEELGIARGTVRKLIEQILDRSKVRSMRQLQGARIHDLEQALLDAEVTA